MTRQEYNDAFGAGYASGIRETFAAILSHAAGDVPAALEAAAADLDSMDLLEEVRADFENQ